MGIIANYTMSTICVSTATWTCEVSPTATMPLYPPAWTSIHDFVQSPDLTPKNWRWYGVFRQIKKLQFPRKHDVRIIRLTKTRISRSVAQLRSEKRKQFIYCLRK